MLSANQQNNVDTDGLNGVLFGGTGKCKFNENVVSYSTLYYYFSP
jgi:hypothetical protein